MGIIPEIGRIMPFFAKKVFPERSQDFSLFRYVAVLKNF